VEPKASFLYCIGKGKNMNGARRNPWFWLSLSSVIAFFGWSYHALIAADCGGCNLQTAVCYTDAAGNCDNANNRCYIYGVIKPNGELSPRRTCWICAGGPGNGWCNAGDPTLNCTMTTKFVPWIRLTGCNALCVQPAKPNTYVSSTVGNAVQQGLNQSETQFLCTVGAGEGPAG
jgi:hypothetical protein